MENNTLLKVRKFQGEEYKFYFKRMNSWVDGEEVTYITCETPENCFGYVDHIRYDSKYNQVVLGERSHPNWIIKKIEEVLRTLTEQYCY